MCRHAGSEVKSHQIKLFAPTSFVSLGYTRICV